MEGDGQLERGWKGMANWKGMGGDGQLEGDGELEGDDMLSPGKKKKGKSVYI